MVESTQTNSNGQSHAANGDYGTESLRAQLRRLQSDVNSLSREVGGVGRAYARRGTATAYREVRAHPLATVLLSFFAGALVSGLLGLGVQQRRRRLEGEPVDTYVYEGSDL